MVTLISSIGAAVTALFVAVFGLIGGGAYLLFR